MIKTSQLSRCVGDETDVSVYPGCVRLRYLCYVSYVRFDGTDLAPQMW